MNTVNPIASSTTKLRDIFSEYLNGLYASTPTETEPSLTKMAPPPVEKSEKSPETEDKKKQQIVEIKNMMRNYQMSFEISQEDNEIILKILDPESKEVIRQIPAEEILNIRKNIKKLSDWIQGISEDVKSKKFRNQNKGLIIATIG